MPAVNGRNQRDEVAQARSSQGVTLPQPLAALQKAGKAELKVER
jgi:hypothetical protein